MKKSADTDTQTYDLVTGILSLRNRDGAERFLADLLTKKEIQEFENRFAAAQMLIDDVSYATIQKKTGLSSTTVARVADWLVNGMNGYKTVIAHLHHHHKTSLERGLS